MDHPSDSNPPIGPIQAKFLFLAGVPIQVQINGYGAWIDLFLPNWDFIEREYVVFRIRPSQP
jgi:hypothetical protein